MFFRGLKTMISLCSGSREVPACIFVVSSHPTCSRKRNDQPAVVGELCSLTEAQSGCSRLVGGFNRDPGTQLLSSCGPAVPEASGFASGWQEGKGMAEKAQPLLNCLLLTAHISFSPPAHSPLATGSHMASPGCKGVWEV